MSLAGSPMLAVEASRDSSVIRPASWAVGGNRKQIPLPNGPVYALVPTNRARAVVTRFKLPTQSAKK